MKGEANRTRSVVCVLVLVLHVATFASCAASREKLGDGYTLVTKRVKSASTFERYAYRDYLRYRSRNLGEVGFVSLSPTGRFALFEQEGALKLFDASQGEVSDVAHGEFSVPKAVRWNEDAGAAAVVYLDDHGPTEVTLP